MFENNLILNKLKSKMPMVYVILYVHNVEPKQIFESAFLLNDITYYNIGLKLLQ